MKLLTEELEKRFAEVGRQEGDKNPIVIAKFFNPIGAGSWFCTEYNPEEKIFFGYASIFGDGCDEWGSISLSELEEFRGYMGLGIERDLYCGERRISEFNIKSL